MAQRSAQQPSPASTSPTTSPTSTLENYYIRYCETLLAVDEGLGRILKKLETRGELQETLLIFLGDNGFKFGEQGLIDKRSAYEASMRIPLLLHCPEVIKPGSIIKRVVANIDIEPDFARKLVDSYTKIYGRAQFLQKLLKEKTFLGATTCYVEYF